MSWATLWAKAKENRARNNRIVWRGRAVMFGAILAASGGLALYSDVMHQIRGRPAMATLMAHIKQCAIEYQLVGEQPKKQQLPCDMAEDIWRRVGADKVKLSKDLIARVQFALEDGRTREAEVDDVKLGSLKLAIGTTLPVVYAPDNPADVRAKMSWETVKIPLLLLAVGSLFLVPSLIGLFTVLSGWRSRGRGEETVTADSEHFVAASQGFERMSSNMVQRNPVAPAAGAFARSPGRAPRTSFGMRDR